MARSNEMIDARERTRVLIVLGVMNSTGESTSSSFGQGSLVDEKSLSKLLS